MLSKYSHGRTADSLPDLDSDTLTSSSLSSVLPLYLAGGFRLFSFPNLHILKKDTLHPCYLGFAGLRCVDWEAPRHVEGLGYD